MPFRSLRRHLSGSDALPPRRFRAPALAGSRRKSYAGKWQCHSLLYAFALNQGWRLEEYASTPAEVLEILRSRGGCRWLAVETSDRSGVLAAARLLREAVQGDAFQKMASFPLHARARLDIYRLNIPIQAPPETVELPFPILGAGTRYRVKPIPARDVVHDS